MTAASPEGCLSSTVTTAQKESERLRQCVINLEQKLHLLTRPAMPCVARDKDAARATLAPMTERVVDLSASISQSCEMLEDVISRIET